MQSAIVPLVTAVCGYARADRVIAGDGVALDPLLHRWWLWLLAESAMAPRRGPVGAGAASHTQPALTEPATRHGRESFGRAAPSVRALCPHPPENGTKFDAATHFGATNDRERSGPRTGEKKTQPSRRAGHPVHPVGCVLRVGVARDSRQIGMRPTMQLTTVAGDEEDQITDEGAHKQCPNHGTCDQDRVVRGDAIVVC